MSQMRRAVVVFSALPGTTRGIAWMIFATIFYAATYGVVRLLSTEFGVFQLVFFRSIIGLFLMLPWLIRGGVGQIKTPQPVTYAWRSTLNYGGMVFLIFGLSTMQLQDVTGLMFTTPLFTVLFVTLFLREQVGPRRAIALLVGFAGAMIIIRPGFQELTWAALGVLGTSSAYAVINVLTKTLARTDSSNTIVFYDFFLLSLLGIVPAIIYWSEVRLEHIFWVAVMGICSSLARQGVIRALAEGEASVVMPFNFLKLPFTVCIGFVWFAENPDLWTGIGAAVIFASTYYIARHETVLKSDTTAKPSPPV
jgi:drug/metabolite transporter (DMT)-like permease